MAVCHLPAGKITACWAESNERGRRYIYIKKTGRERLVILRKRKKNKGCKTNRWLKGGVAMFFLAFCECLKKKERRTKDEGRRGERVKGGEWQMEVEERYGEEADRKKIYVQRKEGDEKKKLGWKRRERWGVKLLFQASNRVKKKRVW